MHGFSMEALSIQCGFLSLTISGDTCPHPALKFGIIDGIYKKTYQPNC